MQGPLLAVLLAESLVFLAGPLQGQSARALLLRVETTTTELFSGITSTEELVVFHDGVVLSSITREDGSRVFSRLFAPRESMERLGRSLSENHVGFAQGDCGVVPPVVNTAATVEVTWYGRPPRKHTFSLRAPGAPDCGPETTAIYVALVHLRLEAGSYDPGAVGVRLVLPPGPGCDAEGESP